MVRIGLTVDEFVDLKIKPRASADRAFHEAAEIERERMFPMTLAAAASHLRLPTRLAKQSFARLGRLSPGPRCTYGPPHCRPCRPVP